METVGLEKLIVNEKIILAKNPNVSINILEKLSTHEDYKVRRAVALNVKTPVTILEELSMDEDHLVREVVAFRAKKTTIGIGSYP